jgi:hypothetical protein
MKRVSSGQWSGAIFHAAAAVVVFLAWRLLGMPFPATLGRLIPLELALTALIIGRRPVSVLSPLFLGCFLLSAIFWASGPGMLLVASVSGVLASFPGMLTAAQGRAGLFRALLPIAPLIILLTLFTGDEPHHATITEGFVAPGAGLFGNLTAQHGDPTEGTTHHQQLYPLLLVPGYPLGIPGVRLLNLLFAAGAAVLLARLMAGEGMEETFARRTALLGMLMVPGIGILGLVYPGWCAVMLLTAGVLIGSGERPWGKRLVWLFLVSFLLFMVKTRFAGLSIGLLAALSVTSRGWRRWSIPVAAVAGILFLLALDMTVLDGRLFMVRYGNALTFRYLFANIFRRFPSVALGMLSSMVDGESGLLWRAPWLLAALAGLPALWRKSRTLFVWLGLPAVSYLAMLFLWMPMDWASAPTPPGRLLLPAAPILMASFGFMLRERSVRILVWISLAVSAAYLAFPSLRFNFFDGTDSLMAALWGRFSNLVEWLPSQVRPRLLPYLGWTLWAVLLIRLCTFRRGRLLPAGLMATALGIGVMAAHPRTSWEAEDIPPDYRTFCVDYPEERDPADRMHWISTVQRMLLMNDPRDSVRLPIQAAEGDTVEVTVRFISIPDAGPVPGILLSCGAEAESLIIASVHFEKEVLQRRDSLITLPWTAGYFSEITEVFRLRAGTPPCTLTIMPLGVGPIQGPAQGIYLHRVEVVR